MTITYIFIKCLRCYIFKYDIFYNLSYLHPRFKKIYIHFIDRPFLFLDLYLSSEKLLIFEGAKTRYWVFSLQLYEKQNTEPNIARNKR